MKVCVVMAVAQLLIWATWAGISRHPSRWKLWVVVFGGALAMLLEIYDFPPYYGFLDAHAIWHATTIPLTYIWWSFIRDDAEFQTANMLKKAKQLTENVNHYCGLLVLLPEYKLQELHHFFLSFLNLLSLNFHSAERQLVGRDEVVIKKNVRKLI